MSIAIVEHMHRLLNMRSFYYVRLFVTRTDDIKLRQRQTE